MYVRKRGEKKRRNNRARRGRYELRGKSGFVRSESPASFQNCPASPVQATGRSHGSNIDAPRRSRCRGTCRNHAERQREAERLHQQVITNEFPPAARENEVDIIFINPDDIDVPLWHSTYASVNPREKKSARRQRQQAAAEAEALRPAGDEPILVTAEVALQVRAER